MKSNKPDLQSVLTQLESGDRHVRRRILQKLADDEVVCDSDSGQTKAAIFAVLEQALIRIFSGDGSEVNRGLAIRVYASMCCGRTDDESLSQAVPALHGRLVLGGADTEPSEEIRLELVRLLTLLIDQCQAEIGKYVGECIAILASTIQDVYLDTVKETCVCASKLAKALATTFHTQSETLVNSFITTTAHKNSKVRRDVIKCIGELIQYGSNTSVNVVVSHFAQRLFDGSSDVRLAVVGVVGQWLLSLPDRYSYHHKLIPLLLTGIKDDQMEVRALARRLWLDVGLQFVEENEERLKDELEFAKPCPPHYPPGVTRPNLGCRKLVERHLSKILPGLANDLCDWSVETRTMASALLTSLILNSEGNMMQHLAQIISILIKAAVDLEKAVVQNVLSCSELIGYFISPSSYVKMFLEHITSLTPPLALLRVLAGVVSTTPPELLSPHIHTLAQALDNTHLIHTQDTEQHKEMLLCVSCFLDKCFTTSTTSTSTASTTSSTPSTTTCHIITILVSVRSLTQQQQQRDLCDHLLSVLSSSSSLSSPSHLISSHLAPLMEAHILPTYSHWTSRSYDALLFTNLIDICGIECVKVFPDLLPIFTENLQRHKEPELRLELLSTLAQLILTWDSIDQHLDLILTNLLLPQCCWHAGATEASLRTMATTCLLSLVGRCELLPHVDKLVEVAVNLIEDESRMTRVLTCRFIHQLLLHTGTRWSTNTLHLVYIKLIERLDDREGDVRREAARALRQYVRCVIDGDTYDKQWSREHVRELYRGLLIYLDDPEEEMRDTVLDILKEASQILPELLLEETEKVQGHQRQKKYSEDLIEHIRSLKI